MTVIRLLSYGGWGRSKALFRHKLRAKLWQRRPFTQINVSDRMPTQFHLGKNTGWEAGRSGEKNLLIYKIRNCIIGIQTDLLGLWETMSWETVCPLSRVLDYNVGCTDVWSDCLINFKKCKRQTFYYLFIFLIITAEIGAPTCYCKDCSQVWPKANFTEQCRGCTNEWDAVQQELERSQSVER